MPSIQYFLNNFSFHSFFFNPIIKLNDDDDHDDDNDEDRQTDK